jgi:O-antigen/teichoic acid export membrane protein
VRTFFFWMAFAAALGFAKVVVLAKLLPSADFGNYVMVLGASALLTMVLPFGLIEGTIKRFPRLWVDGAKGEMRAESRHIALAVLVPTGGLVALLLPVWWFRPDIVVPCLLGVVLGYVGILARVESALIQAIGAPRLLGQFSVFRAVTALALALLGGWLGDWRGAIAGEVVAALLSVLQAKIALRPHLGHPSGVRLPASRVRDRGLYLSAVLTSATTMADRGIINLLSGAALAGSYGFVMILPQAGQVVTNIIGQRVGPGLIRSQKRTGRLDAAQLLKAAALVVGAALALTVAALAMSLFGEDLLVKYRVGAVAIILAGFICASYFHVILEYALISLNRERSVLVAGLSAFVVFATGFLLAQGLIGYLLAALATRLVQTLWLLAALARGPHVASPS